MDFGFGDLTNSYYWELLLYHLGSGSNVTRSCALPTRSLKVVLPQQFGLPGVFPLGKPVWDFDFEEILDTFFQLFLNGELLLHCFFLAGVGLPGAGGESPEQVALPADLGLLQQLHRPLLGRPVQSLNVGLARDRAADHGLLGGAGLGLAVAARRGQLVAGCAALTLLVTFAVLAAAVAVGRGPAGGLTCRGTESPGLRQLQTPTHPRTGC